MRWSWLLMLVVAIIIMHAHGCKGWLEEEKRGLMEIKESLKIHNASMDKFLLPSWVSNTNSDICSWERVTCNSSSGHIISLSLYNLTWDDKYFGCLIVGLNLNLPLFLPFSHLTTLNLSSNCFNHIIGVQGGRNKSMFAKLETLDLSHNQLLEQSLIKPLGALKSLKNLFLADCFMYAPFPVQDLAVLPNLEQLDLSYNSFISPTIQDYGSLPMLKKLKTLDLSWNKLDENIFKYLVAQVKGDRNKSVFTKLETLDLSHNHKLEQSIIKSLGGVKSLKNLFLSDCFINGPFPLQDLAVLPDLEQLDLSYNLLTSPTIQDFGSFPKLKKLKTLDLSRNSLDENIFKYLVAFPALKSLFLSHNTGNMNGMALDDKVLTNLRNLEVLIIRESRLNRSLPIKGLCKMMQLQELDLSDNEFTGTLHTCLGNLTSLRALDLSSNSLTGIIPPFFITPLTSLEYLSLSANSFEGSFSFSILANHSKLKVLSIGDNYNTSAFLIETENPPWIPSFQLEYLRVSHFQMNSTIPSFLFYQRGLEFIDLTNNNIVDMSPNWLFANNSKLTSVILGGNCFSGLLLPPNLNHTLDTLQQLEVSNNKFQGNLPRNIGYFLPHLIYLDVSNNMFDGEIPASIGEMSNLIILDLSNNFFFGIVPKQILLGCVSLQVLRMSNNSLHGNIFSAPTNLGSLGILIADNNKFNGTLEDGFLSQTLTMLDISYNNLSGILPSWIINSQLFMLSVSSNKFEGEIPVELCKNVIGFLDLSNNRFSNAIPSCLFNSSDLRYIFLRGNILTGTLPKIRSPIVKVVDVSHNKIYGSIPKSFYEVSDLGVLFRGFPQLRVLLLAGNELEGPIPSQICQLKYINFLDLSHNHFTGSIPLCFDNMSFGNYSFIIREPVSQTSVSNVEYFYPHFLLTKKVHAHSYGNYEVQFVTKSLSYSYKGKGFENMSGLDLSSNQFTGGIPYQIGNLQALHALNLSHNHLSGTIPENFHNLKEIESLDFSYNYLEGEIPPQLQDLNYLSTFYVCYNNLSGRAPDHGQFATFDDRNYEGNKYLSWNNSNKHIATSPALQTPLDNTEGSESMIDPISFYWSFGVSYVMLLTTLVTILWINPYWRRVWFYYIYICLEKSFGRFFKVEFF